MMGLSGTATRERKLGETCKRSACGWAAEREEKAPHLLERFASNNLESYTFGLAEIV
jgi:hypothetical protein